MSKLLEASRRARLVFSSGGARDAANVIQISHWFCALTENLSIHSTWDGVGHVVNVIAEKEY